MLTLAGVVAGVGFTSVPAHADDGPDGRAENCRVQSICVGVEDKPSPAGRDKARRGGKAASESSVRCKVERVKAPPPASHPVWKGKSPKKGSLFFRACTDGSTSGVDGFIYVPDGQDAPDADPAEVAQQALDKMTLRRPTLAMSPKPGGEGLVGLPVWLAVDETSKDRFGPVTAEASAGGVTVTATAKVSRVVWRLGDGSSETCTATEMKPYKRSYGLSESACGHIYDQLPENAVNGRGAYRVSATAYWDVDWQVAGGGESGALDTSRTTSRPLTVLESQAVN